MGGGRTHRISKEGGEQKLSSEPRSKVYLDVWVLLRRPLDEICWDKIERGEVSAAAFYHPHFGTPEHKGRDFVESWFLATRKNNPFFMKWRDLFKELFHNRLETEGLLQHPLYQDVLLERMENFVRLNERYDPPFDFREYLAIHATCRRILETEEELRQLWDETWLHLDAAETAFRLQLECATTAARVQFLCF